MARFPADSESRRIDSRACAIVHYTIDSSHWEYRLASGRDFGCDAVLELSENNYWTGGRVRLQIKGTRNIERYLVNKNSEISFPLSVDTLNYTISSPESFLLLVVDVESESVYFCELHDYLKAHDDLAEKMESQKTINIRFPCANVLISDHDFELQTMAKRCFVSNHNGWFTEAVLDK